MIRKFIFLAGFYLLISENTHATQQDSLSQDSVKQKVYIDILKGRFTNLYRGVKSKDTVQLLTIQNQPFVSMAQYVKGQIAGLHVQERSGEPGSYKSIVYHGQGAPIITNKDFVDVQPAIYVNGVPISPENNFAYAIQQYQFNRLGPSTDSYAGIALSLIESIEVVKDPQELAKLGPLAANGAILIRTKLGKSGQRQITFNSSLGYALKPSITPVNGQYEHRFRSQFYAKYATDQQKENYPGYLSDSTNMNYYGAADWADQYFRNTAMQTGDIGIRGGSDRASFGFYGGYTKNASAADETKYERYHALFNVNMAPFKWFNMGATINGSKSHRDRNKSLRDRFGEAAYRPDLAVPIGPTKNIYNQYLQAYDQGFDDNIVNAIQGLLTYDIYFNSALKYNSSLAIDYNEGYRDVFFPSSLMESNNYTSNYFGFSQRYVYTNRLLYNVDLKRDMKLELDLGSVYQQDLQRFTYARAYDGPSDFVKINVVNGDASAENYLQPVGGLYVNRWTNREDFKMHSLYLAAAYKYRDRLDLSALLRYDGASTMQPDSRWMLSPAASATYHFVKEGMTSGWFDKLDLSAQWARIAKPVTSSRYAIGPNYAADLKWGSEAGLVSYNGFAVVSRPYSEGWVGYNMKWPYTDHGSIKLDAEMFAKRMNIAVDLYQKKDMNQIVAMPVPAEYGYTGQLLNGLDVQNRGVDISIAGQILKSTNGVNWRSTLVAAYNKNKLLALPNNANELQVGDRKLVVGEAIDRFWLYENKGSYSSGNLTYEGISLKEGDPLWKDQNNDGQIDDEDRVLKGNAMPKWTGGFNNQWSYRGFDFQMQWVYALGLNLLNQHAANKYNFVNNETENSLSGIKEVFHWQQDIQLDKYPIYNPWSAVVPYRTEQDLFLENASYLKLRSISLGYDLATTSSLKNKMKTLRKAYLYVSATNLLTISKFSGRDPELTDFNGMYTGYGLPMSPIVTMGLKLEL